jgi:hypothetical protein
MPLFPSDAANYRPAKIIFKVDVLTEVDRAVRDGLGGYADRHELINDLVEQGLIDLRYPSSDGPFDPPSQSAGTASAGSGKVGDDAPRASVLDDEGLRPVPSLRTSTPPQEPTIETEAGVTTLDRVEPLKAFAETAIITTGLRGHVVENELARVPNEPMFGMHNRDAPSVWALARLAEEASSGPIPLGRFYESATAAAWKLAAQLAPFETKGDQKLAVMMPRNPEKPQSAADGFRAFALGQVAKKPEDGRLPAWGPFYQWGAAGIVGDLGDPHLGLTQSGWELLGVTDGLSFALPHEDAIAWSFLQHLRQHAPADLWGFVTALEAAANDVGRLAMTEWFRLGLVEDFSQNQWKRSVAESVASGYVSRARAWGLLEPKLDSGLYRLTAPGHKALDELSGDARSKIAAARVRESLEDGEANA